MSALLDKETIDELLEMVADTPEILAEIIDAYLEQGSMLIEAISQAIAEKNIQKLQAASHSLKGSSYNMGAVPLAELAADLEKKASDADWQSLGLLFIELQSCYTDSVFAINSLRSA